MTQDAEAARNPRRDYMRSGIATLAIIIAMSLLYATLPWQRIEVSDGTVAVVVFVVGIVGIGALVWWQAFGFRRKVASGSARLRGLLVAVYTAVLFFAASYYTLVSRSPDQIDGLHTRLDAVYFAVVTLSTVGYGDIHAQGQAARGMVTLQIVFDLVVISLAIAAARAALAEHPISPRHDDTTDS